MLEKLLGQLNSELELPPISASDDKKIYHLALNPEMTISLKQLDPGIYLHAKVAPCPKEKREDFFIFLMRANFLGLGTGGSTLGLSEDEKFLTLSLALPYEMDYRTFKETLEDFVNFIDYWKEETTRHQKAAQEGLFS